MTLQECKLLVDDISKNYREYYMTRERMLHFLGAIEYDEMNKATDLGVTINSLAKEIIKMDSLVANFISKAERWEAALIIAYVDHLLSNSAYANRFSDSELKRYIE